MTKLRPDAAPRRRAAAALVATAALVAAGLTAAAPAAAAGPAAPGAPGAPGAPSSFDLARKDCVGTARNGGSKVWFTVADGVLSDVYEPTIDNTDVKSLQYVVTDGSTFTDLQTRDPTYTVAADPTGMSCTVTATSAAHGYQLVTTYVADPARDAVLLHTRLRATPGSHTLPPCTSTPTWTPTSTATAAAVPTTAAPTPARSTPPASASSATPARSARRPTGTTPSPPSWR